MELQHKRVLRFFVALIGWCIVLMAPWPGLKDRCGVVFAASANWLIETCEWSTQIANAEREVREGLFGTPAKVKLEFAGEQRILQTPTDPDLPPNPDRLGHDIRMWIGNAAQADARGYGNISSRWLTSRHIAYMPVATLLALVLASPVGWRRRLAALAWGLPLMCAFVLLRFALLVLWSFHGSQPYCLFELQGASLSAFEALMRLTVLEPASTYLIPLLIWLLITFRSEDAAFIGIPTRHATPEVAASASRPPAKRASERGGSKRAPRSRRRQRKQPRET